MTTYLRGTRAPRVLAPLAVAGTAAVLALVPTGTALADTPAGTVTGAYAGDGVGYNNVYDGNAAGTTLLKVENGDTIEAFCVQQAKSVARDGSYTARTWSAAGVANLAHAADLAVHHASLGTKLTNAQAENTATQLAIWHFTDAVDFAKVPNAQIVARATELVGAAGSLTEGPSSFVLTTHTSEAGTGAAAKDTVVAHLATAAGAPLAGQPVTIAAAGTTQKVTTDANGDAALTVAAPGQTAPATATFAGTLPAGSLLAPAGGQAMVTIQGAPVTRTASATLAAAPADPATPTTAAPTPAAPTPAKVTTAAPTPAKATPVATPAKLPYTGTWVQPWMALVAGAAAVGGFLTRRRFHRTR